MESIDMVPLSSRVLEISKRREELLGLLHDLPESEYELSFTDLIEKSSSTSGGSANDQHVAVTSKNTITVHEGDQQHNSSHLKVIKERKTQRKVRKSSFGSDGVLLNLYVPTSLTRSFTMPRSRKGANNLCGDVSDDSKRFRDRDSTFCLGCLSTIWDRKSRRGA